MPDPQGSDLPGVPQRTTIVSIVAAGLLVILKLGAGLLAGSLGLISAGIESSGDVVAATLTYFAVRLAVQPADPEHPYGHRRAENLGALGEAAILLAGGAIVAITSAATASPWAKPSRTSNSPTRTTTEPAMSPAK